MLDKAKTTIEAQKLLAKGQIDKAIELWQQISAEYPDANTYNYIGDLYLKKGNKDGAVSEYHKAAKIYTKEGFSLKALAIHKKVLNINPKDPDALIALGELNEQKNIVTDAIKYYLAAADVISKRNDKEALLAVYNRILKLAPENAKLRLKIVELFSKEGWVAETAAEYCNIGQLFASQGDMESAMSYMMKASEIQPGNRKVLLSLSELYERNERFAEAAEYINKAIERTGEDAQILARKSHLLMKTGKVDEAQKSLERALAADPANVDLRKTLAEMYQQLGDISAAWDEYKKIITKLIDDDKTEDAKSILNTFKDFEPIENRHLLVRVYKMLADEESAVRELVEVHQLYLDQDMIEEAKDALREVLEIWPGEADIQARLEALEAPEPQEEPAFEEPAFDEPAPDFEEPEPVAEPVSKAPAREMEPVSGGKPLSEIMNEVEVFVKYGLFNDAKALLEKTKEDLKDNVFILLKLKEILKKTAEIDALVGVCIEIDAVYKAKGDSESGKIYLKEAFEMRPADDRLVGLVEGATGAPKPPSIEQYAEKLGEADFYIQQGFYNEAAEVYRGLLKIFPDSVDLKNKLDEVDILRAQEGTGIEIEAPPVAPQPEPAQVKVTAPPKAAPEVKPFAGEAEESGLMEDQLFDISSMLEDEGEDLSLDLDEEVQGIFDEFKRGLSQEIEAEDSATHYDLGIAYKEMGIVDDAIKEFNISQRDPKYFSQSTTMIGLCYMIKGSYSRAIDAFSAALMKNQDEENRWSLMYDLAEAYMKKGDKAEAARYFKEVYSWDPGFRDTSKYMSQLGESPQAQAAAPVQAAPAKPAPVEAAKSRKSRVSYI